MTALNFVIFTGWILLTYIFTMCVFLWSHQGREIKATQTVRVLQYKYPMTMMVTTFSLTISSLSDVVDANLATSSGRPAFSCRGISPLWSPNKALPLDPVGAQATRPRYRPQTPVQACSPCVPNKRPKLELPSIHFQYCPWFCLSWFISCGDKRVHMHTCMQRDGQTDWQTYRQTHIERQIQADRHMEKQPDEETDRHTDRETDRQTKKQT